MPTSNQLTDLLLNRLFWTSLQAIVLISIVVLTLRLLPKLPAYARCALWWLVALQTVLGLCWPSPVQLPLLTPAAPITVVQAGVEPQVVPAVQVATERTPESASDWRTILTWRNGLAALWLLGVVAQLPAMVRDSRRIRRTISRAGVPTEFLQQQCEALSRSTGLRHCPRLRVSSDIASPLVAGLIHPTILWPSGRALTGRQTALALAHELTHLSRRDLWLGLIPAAAQRLFFFHPLVRWAMREYAVHREAACDARAMQEQHAEPGDYGRLLLRFGVANCHPATLAGASNTFRSLKRRLAMLQSAGIRSPRIRWLTLVVLIAAVGVMPYRIVAAGKPAPTGSSRGEQTSVPTPSTTTRKTGSSNGIVVCCGRSEIAIAADGKQQGVVIFNKGDVIISGTADDVAAAKPFYNADASLLWFRRDGEAYVVRDLATIERAVHLYAPARKALGQLNTILEQQGELSSRQGRISEKQGKLSEQQAELAAQQSDWWREAPGRSRTASSNGLNKQQHDIAKRLRLLKQEQMRLDKEQKLMVTESAELTSRVHASKRRLRDVSRNLKGQLDELLDAALSNGSAENRGKTTQNPEATPTLVIDGDVVPGTQTEQGLETLVGALAKQ